MSIMLPSRLASTYSCDRENKAALSSDPEHPRKILSLESVSRASFVVPIAATAMLVAQIFSSKAILMPPEVLCGLGLKDFHDDVAKCQHACRSIVVAPLGRCRSILPRWWECHCLVSWPGMKYIIWPLNQRSRGQRTQGLTVLLQHIMQVH